MPFIYATMLFMAWTTATYLLEGRRRTLLRPEASSDRLVYAVTANMLIGTIGSALVAHWMPNQPAAFFPDFTSPGNLLISLTAAFTLGVLLLVIQKPPAWNPVILINGFSQTLVVSIAEVLVCWAVLGNAVASANVPAGKTVSITAGLIIASAAFGIYHFAHSPPFNTPKMVTALTVVGFTTGVFFFLSRNIYATIVFHNFLALKGVTESLSKAGRLDRYRRFQPPLITMALFACVLLIVTKIVSG